MIVLALSAAAVYMIWKAKSGGAASGNATAAKPAGWVDEIFDLGGKKFTNGWRYFNDGTAIDPLGNYYKDGAMIWQAPGAARVI